MIVIVTIRVNAFINIFLRMVFAFDISNLMLTRHEHLFTCKIIHMIHRNNFNVLPKKQIYLFTRKSRHINIVSFYFIITDKHLNFVQLMTVTQSNINICVS